MYAATFPRSVVGMVMVDGRLPGDIDIQDRFYPPQDRLDEQDWSRSVERLSDSRCL